MAQHSNTSARLNQFSTPLTYGPSRGSSDDEILLDSAEDQSIAPYIDNKLDRVLFSVNSKSAWEAFQNHGISDIWLPIPSQTVKKILTDNREREIFLVAQKDLLDSAITLYSEQASTQTPNLGHGAIEDDEELIIEHRMLGEGAYGTVEEVSIVTSNEQIKCVRKRIGRPKQLKGQKQVIAAFAREINVMRRVDHHHCVKFLGSYTDTDHVNILSSPVADMDLATLMDRPINVKVRQTLYRGIGCLCSAIDYLHHNEIRHEDLKPQNVLIHEDHILLTDFGFSLDFSDDSVSTTTGRPSAWTVRYSAPEVLNSEPRNRASDIYSLGCVLLEMISAYHGVGLTALKAHWKKTGNGESSFARNPKALDAWRNGQMREGGFQMVFAPKMEFLCDIVEHMLENEQMYRPTARHIMHSLSDLSILFPDHVEHVVANCARTLMPCVGISHHADTTMAFPLTIVEKLNNIPYLGENLFGKVSLGWEKDVWTMSEVWSLHAPDLPTLDLMQDHKQKLQQVCKVLYDRACRTGATKHFWEAHERFFHKRLRNEGGFQMIVSARLITLKHIVFTRLSVQSSADSTGMRYNIQVTLLPNCLPRSPGYGSFYWMISYALFGPANDQHYDPEISFVDLTIE